MHPSTPTPPHFPEPRWEFTKRMELSLDEHRHLKAYTEERGLLFFSSPFSVEAVELLEELDTPLYKIASGEVTNPPLLEAIAATGKPVLLSTGMSGLAEVDAAMEILRAASADGDPPVHLELPVPAGARQPARDAGARRALRGALRALRSHARHPHLDRGRRPRRSAIEKHFTLSKRLYGPDHHASLTPEELARLVTGIREVEAALGSDKKVRDPALDPARATFEKSVVTRVAIPAGATIEREMLTTKRPGNGIPAVRLGEVVGRRAATEIPANELVQEAQLG